MPSECREQSKTSEDEYPETDVDKDPALYAGGKTNAREHSAEDRDEIWPGVETHDE